MRARTRVTYTNAVLSRRSDIYGAENRNGICMRYLQSSVKTRYRVDKSEFYVRPIQTRYLRKFQARVPRARTFACCSKMDRGRLLEITMVSGDKVLLNLPLVVPSFLLLALFSSTLSVLSPWESFRIFSDLAFTRAEKLIFPRREREIFLYLRDIVNH